MTGTIMYNGVILLDYTADCVHIVAKMRPDEGGQHVPVHKDADMFEETPTYVRRKRKNQEHHMIATEYIRRATRLDISQLRSHKKLGEWYVRISANLQSGNTGLVG
ncbi:4163_t:CDS:2 [Paraglomus occultum]|uniref:4162_t:CDS:1 n=1 Tax=Paraglomus occultum TaxID=144539 RepID=A0A9N8ZVT7_9GLOM|nr:4162_t:CDS:2 [Paraglomus occultum]CAG8510141.1 4163_t:CDS:2 [Paraglomus occultum]